VIPETANLLGTIRTLSEETREAAHAGIARVAENVARAHECEAEVLIERGFPVTVCDARAVGVAEQAIGSLFGAGSWKTMSSPVMGAEDFSYVLNRVPGVMVFLGVCPEGQKWKSACPCHSNKMVLNEAMLARMDRRLALLSVASVMAPVIEIVLEAHTGNVDLLVIVAASMVLFMLVILFRPEGLLGKAEERKV
jgi:metal-dependent amidase/aminoacylase/carboxypeptidase family protein